MTRQQKIDWLLKDQKRWANAMGSDAFNVTKQIDSFARDIKGSTDKFLDNLYKIKKGERNEQK